MTTMKAEWQQVTTKALTLAPEGRARLAHLLIASLEGEADQGAEATWDKEIEKRVREVHAGKVVGKPAPKVFAQARARLQ